MFALASAMPMNLSSTELICSRDTSLSSAIAMPNFCTSRALSCLSTLAASCSPRLISKMAARCVPASSSLAIRGDPVLHYLCSTPGILPDQGSGGHDLLLETRRKFDRLALSRQAQGVAVDLLARACGRAPRRLGERLHQRPQYQECHDQHQSRADDLLGELNQPRLLPQRQAIDRRQHGVALECLIHHVDLIAAIILETDRLLDQLREAFDVALAHRRGRDLAVGIDFLPIVEHHTDVETLQGAHRLLHIR